jgi:hypothetical protein
MRAPRGCGRKCNRFPLGARAELIIGLSPDFRMSLLSLLKSVHLIGLILGLGGAALADYLIVTRAIISPVNRATARLVKDIGRAVAIGLAILWVSGIALVAIRMAANANFLMNEKLWAKLVIVNLLTINGVFVHAAVIPCLERSLGTRLFQDLAAGDIAALTLVASLSSVSWLTPFFLGVASELNFVTPIESILSIYAMAILLAWVTLFAGVMTFERHEAAKGKTLHRSNLRYAPARDRETSQRPR